MVHELKTWSKYFQLVASGKKNFELRFNDRGFRTGHELLLREFEQNTKTYTGSTLHFKISYVLNSDEGADFGLKPGYCIMGLEEL